MLCHFFETTFKNALLTILLTIFNSSAITMVIFALLISLAKLCKFVCQTHCPTY